MRIQIKPEKNYISEVNETCMLFWKFFTIITIIIDLL